MPFSHHSHSGQFCAHAKGSLEEMVQTAITLGMTVYALTEHMGRDMEDLYPEESKIIFSPDDFDKISADFHKEAVRLREKYESRIKILIGFESEWIRPSSLLLIRKLQAQYPWDFFVGSVHHVHAIPIDFDRQMYEDARQKAGGSDEALFEDYFDAQYDMLQAIRPPLVGHFDLIRLMSDEPNASMSRFSNVWSKVRRNLEFVASYEGVLELNSSALRKNMHEPYPAVDICRIFLELGGNFTLSDDAHSVEQVGLNYSKVKTAIGAAGIARLVYFQKRSAIDETTASESIPLAELENHSLFSA